MLTWTKDDLGNTRQDDLPLDDKPKHHDQGRNFRHGGRRAYSHGFQAPPQARRAQPQNNNGGMSWSLDDVWKGGPPSPMDNDCSI